jgi:hypothetical protein
VVENYIDVYSLYLRYMQDTLTGDDSTKLTTIANLCPAIEGTIVYMARGLYSTVTGQVVNYDDACLSVDTSSGKHSNPAINPVIKNINDATNAGQNYTLQPNPNNGNFTVSQKITDNTTTKLQVWNATGRVVISGNIQFTGGNATIHIPDAIPGLYLLQLTDNSGNSFTRKFVVE